MTIWTLQTRLSRHLLVWSALSIATGAFLLFAPPFWQGVGVQALVWGTIDAAIALFGLRALRRRRARAGAHEPHALSHEARNLRRLLLVNAGLDVLYVGAGVAVLNGFASDFARGNGVGIIVQGGFLLLFDAFYALKVQRSGAEVPA
jgi:hypothetical protein